MFWMFLMLGSAASAQVTTPAYQPTPENYVPTGAREPEAIAALEKMGAYLRTLTTFHVSGMGSSEEVLTSGQMIQYPGEVDLLVTRPNRLRANVFSTRKRRDYFYDGSTLTVFAPRMGFYTVVDAPPTIKETIDKASERLDLVIPLSDLFELGVDPALTARITSAFFVSTDVIGDHVCNHFAFRQPNVDWQIWIRDGAEPLPCKWVITSTEDQAQPDYDMEFTWDLKPVVAQNAFTFVPPEGADRIALASVKK
jgi:hypothetical protein